MRPTRAMRHTCQRQPRKHHFAQIKRRSSVTIDEAERALREAGWREMAVEQDVDRLDALEKIYGSNIPKVLLRQLARTKTGGKVYIPPVKDEEGPYVEAARALCARATKKNRRKLQKHQQKDEHGRFIPKKQRRAYLGLETTPSHEGPIGETETEKTTNEQPKRKDGTTQHPHEPSPRESLETAFARAAKPKRKHIPARHCKEVKNKRIRPPQIVIPDVKRTGRGHLPLKCVRRLVGKIERHTLTHPGSS